jgi:hypothetical protein
LAVRSVGCNPFSTIRAIGLISVEFLPDKSGVPIPKQTTVG